MSSSNTETRILQMQLENKDFEDGVRQTIKSLENLEEKLNLKNAGDGFERVSAAANSVQMTHLENGLDAVTNKFTLMGQIGLQVLERISSRVVDTGEKLLRAATVQPMIDGWGEFEMKTNSIQTILGGIRKDFDDQPSAINAISVALDELNEYADKTIYNFAQMTENVGKFTNQGLGLEESTNAIKGIANWAAAVGANPQQMSRAMYNISQSLGAGAMQLIDWRSIRFANMATPEVKKLFAEVAKVQGTLTEEGKVKIGKQTLDVLENFEETLKGGWLTNEVMAEAFSIYANAYSETELIEKYGEELGRTFYEMGVYAEEAATKVRTFSQLMGVLQEALGSGWANTFDILFGGFEQQTEFLTAIKDRIEEIISFQTDDRNTWLQNFSDIGGIIVFQDVILKTLDILTDFYWVFNDVAALVFNPFGQSVFNMSDGIFGPRQEGYTELQTTWEGVKAIFDDISETLSNFRLWMYTPNGNTGRSPIHNLANALSGVAGVAGIAWQVLTGFGKMVFRLFKRFAPLVSAVLDLLGQIGGAIYNVFFNLTGQQSIEKVFDKIESAIGPVIDLVVGLATAVVNLVHNLLGIDAAADDWTVLGERMQAFWDIFKYDANEDFITNIKNSLKKSLVTIFGQDTANSMIQAWDENIAPVLEQISGFFERAFGDLNRVLDGLKKAAEADYSQAEGVKGKGKTFLSAFLSGYFGEDVEGAEVAYTNVLGIYQQIKQYYDEHVAPAVESLNEIFTVTLPQLHSNISDFLLGKETSVVTGPGQVFSYRSGGLLQPVLKYFSGEELSGILESITGFFDDLIEGITVEWNRFYSFLFGKEVVVVTGPGQAFSKRSSGLLQSFTDFFGGEIWQQDWGIIKGAFEEISGWITSTGNAAWNTILDFLFGKETTVVTGPGQAFTKRGGGAYEAALKFLDPVWDWIQKTGQYLYDYITHHNFQEMWDGLNDLLFGYKTTVITGPGQSFDKVAPGVLTPIIEMLRPIAEVFNKIKGWALEKIGSIDWGGIWGSISKLFTGYDELVVYDGGRHKEIVHHDSIFERIASFFERIIEYFQSPEFQEFLGNIKTFYHTYIEPIFNWLSGLGGELWTAVQGLFAGKGFGAFEGVGDYISNGFNSLIGKIFPEGFSLGGLLGGDGAAGGSILDQIIGVFFGGGAETNKDAEKAAEQAAKDSGGGLLGSIIYALSGVAGAEEENASEIADAANGVVATLGEAAGDVENAANKGEKSSNAILDAVSKILPYAGAAAGIGLVGKVGDMITGITGNRKPTILEQIGGVIRSFGEVFKGLGIMIAAAGFAEWVSPDALDKVFNRITGLLNTIFGWIAGIAGGGILVGGLANLGGNALTKKMFGTADGAKVAKDMDFDSASSIISSIGSGLSGLFDGLQTMYNLVWEIMGADLVMGMDENGAYEFDKKLDRVLGLIGKVMLTILGNSTLIEILDMAKNVGTSALAKGLGVESQSESLSKMLMGLGAFVQGLGDGVAAMMTASIVPGMLNLDTQKIVDVINATSGALAALTKITSLSTLTSLLGDKAGWEAFAALAGAGGGLAVALGAIGTVAGFLITWYSGIVTEGLTTMGPAIYTFMSNFTGIIQMIASLGDTQLGAAEKVMSEDLPRLLGYINEENLKFNKSEMDEIGGTIRDFGNRVKTGIDALARAKDAFDKYRPTDGESSFPLAFFMELTEALEYLRGDGIQELYQEILGTILYIAPPTEEPDLDGVESFLNTVNTLGSVVNEYTQNDPVTGIYRSGTELVSTKDGLETFQDAFSGIQQSLHSLFSDISSKDFSTEKINALGTFLKTISEAGHTFSQSFYYEHGNIKLYEQTSPITQFAGWLQTMGTGVRQLNDSLKTNGQYDINYTQIESALKALQPMAEIEKTIYEYSKLTQGANGEPSRDWDFMANTQAWLDEVLPRLQSIGTHLHEMAVEIKPEDIDSLTSASGTLNSLASFMASELYTNIQVMSTEQIGGYASAFNELKQSLLMPEGNSATIASMIQEVVNATGGKPITMRITPIIDDSNLGGNLPDGLSMENTYSRMITMQMNMNDVQNVHLDAAQIQSLVTANNQTRDRIDSLATAIRNIRIQVNAPGPSYGPRARSVQVYPLVANYQSAYEDSNEP